MSFAWPHLLWLLFLPVAGLVWELTHRRRAVAQARPKILRAEAGPRSLHLSPFNAPSAAATSARRIRYWLFAGAALVTVALSRPQFGRIEEPVFDQAREILLAVDLSRSMLAPDVKPSRLARAKLLIQSLLEKVAGERVGLVVFSGTAFLQSPLSADYEILREFLPALDPDFLPEGGTHYGALLDAALGAFTSSGAADRFLIILSDGEATDEEWKARVEDLKKKGVRVISLGVGTEGGAMIPDGTGQFVKDDRGAVVMSRLESGTLQQIARETGGVYRDASAWVDLAALVEETIAAGRKGQFVETRTVRLVERFQWPLALGLWCLLVSFYREFPVRPRVRDIALRPRQEAGTPTPSASQTAAAVLLLFLTSGFWPLNPPARAAEPAPPPEQPMLGKIYARLAEQDRLSARDYADIANETLRWGQRIKEGGQPVIPGPVHDALQAVDELIKTGSKLADWTKLRKELEELLEKPEDDKKDQPQDQPDQNQDQQNQDQQKQDQKKSDQQKKQDKSGQQKSQPQDQNDPADQSPQDQSQQKQDNPQPKPQGESAFGDMDKKDQPPPPPPPGTQKVGGTPDRREDVSNPTDAALAQPLQKLEQLRTQDSPAQLFQLMEGQRKAEKKSGKNW
ncbi:MAG: VWA domain-containing protein [Opitutaceae bacterium]|nr:VWA domain-containing protein [Opitutaceae bacterium]